MSVAAIVPMRHSSSRVVGKNYRPLAGKPLYRHIVESLLAANGITEVVIDTDSELLWEDAARHFPDVRLLERPPHLADEMVSMNDVLLNTVKHVDADIYFQTHSTNPLVRPSSIDAAIDAFVEGRPEYDSLFTVTPVYKRFWTSAGKPVNHNPDRLLRTQDLPPIMEENSCMYIFEREILETRRNRLGARPLLFPLDAEEAFDIDEELDVLVVDGILSKRRDI
ncbi:MAG: acylneuraminate cytidylyltransferase family protein [Actinobacteria bacterium]|nr:acylneuraminate cytidylyltransferase family protein [Actinomycetota bacterium]